MSLQGETDGRVIDVKGQIAVERNVDRNETNAVDRRENAEKERRSRSTRGKTFEPKFRRILMRGEDLLVIRSEDIDERTTTRSKLEKFLHPNDSQRRGETTTFRD